MEDGPAGIVLLEVVHRLLDIDVFQPARHHAHRHLRHALVVQPLGGSGPIAGAVQPGAGIEQRANQRLMRQRMLLRPVLAHAQHLFLPEAPDIVTARHHLPHALRRRQAVPGLTDTEAIQRTAGQLRRHQRRRHGAHLDVAVRIDAARRQPVAQQIAMRRERMHAGQLEQRLTALLALAHMRRQRLRDLQRTGEVVAVLAEGGHQRARQRDGVAAQIERHGTDHRRGAAIQAQSRGQRHQRQHLRTLQHTGLQVITQRRPRGLPLECHRQPLLAEKPQLLSDHEGRGIIEWHQAQRQLMAIQGYICGHHAHLLNDRERRTVRRPAQRRRAALSSSSASSCRARRRFMAVLRRYW